MGSRLRPVCRHLLKGQRAVASIVKSQRTPKFIKSEAMVPSDDIQSNRSSWSTRDWSSEADDKMKNPWVRLGSNAWSLALEASSVIGLRALKIASGGRAAEAETRLMVREKFEAGRAIQGKALAGDLGWTANTATATSRILSHYRRKVRANRRRLAKL